MADWSQGGQGAVGGALAGASIGGPVGGIIGGGLGLLGGLFGGGQDDEYRKRLEAAYGGLGQPSPQAGPAAQSAYSGFRNNQSNLISRLEAMSAGQGPSLAAQQYQMATDRGNAQQQAMSATGRGGPLSAFNAASNMATMGAQNAQGLASARTQEQQMALNQLGLALQGARTSDEQTNRFNAEQTNQTALKNLDARLQSMGIDAQQRIAILQQMGALNNKPGMGSQILAGGAGMFAQGAAMRGNRQGGDGNPYTGSAMQSNGTFGGSPLQGSIVDPQGWF